MSEEEVSEFEFGRGRKKIREIVIELATLLRSTKLACCLYDVRFILGEAISGRSTQPHDLYLSVSLSLSPCLSLSLFCSLVGSRWT